ncbi:MAG: GlsB/YeaQ/YmgE family stress response membrane protein [Candidatus Izimaplasma sp.]|nr:GlsB/YeaQ/YmgE family stress response membrane protein [Candidatus Izimaplasma bacterium]
MDIIIWILFGLLVGWLASIVMHVHGRGLIKNIFIGLVGAFVGGFLGNLIFDIGAIGPFTVSGFIFSFLGAVILIWVLRLLKV